MPASKNRTYTKDPMSESPQKQYLNNFLDWAKLQPDIRAIALIGSAVRIDRPADRWSDYDLLVIASDPQIYLTATDWLNVIACPWFSILESAPSGEPLERRVLFEGGFDMDFIILSTEDARQGFQKTPMVQEISERGRQVLWDRDGLLSSIPAWPWSAQKVQAPSDPAFMEVVNDFWFHVAWTAKKLCRGELWIAKRCCDTYLKDLLLRMIEWEAQSVHGWKINTWFNGRFLEQWALPATVEELHRVFATYDPEAIWQALEASLKLFRRMAQETAERLAYAYPIEKDEQVSAWVARMHTENTVGSRE